MWSLLRSIGSHYHILDVLPKLWPQTVAFFKEAAAFPKNIVDGSLQLLLACDKEAKLTARGKRSAVDMARIRKLVDGNELVLKMLTAAESQRWPSPLRTTRLSSCRAVPSRRR